MRLIPSFEAASLVFSLKTWWVLMSYCQLSKNCRMLLRLNMGCLMPAVSCMRWSSSLTMEHVFSQRRQPFSRGNTVLSSGAWTFLSPPACLLGLIIRGGPKARQFDWTRPFPSLPFPSPTAQLKITFPPVQDPDPEGPWPPPSTPRPPPRPPRPSMTTPSSTWTARPPQPTASRPPQTPTPSAPTHPRPLACPRPTAASTTTPSPTPTVGPSSRRLPRWVARRDSCSASGAGKA